MGSDRARVSYDPKQQYRSVVMQQGRVTLEADFNEELTIAGEDLRKETLDIVGSSGTPNNGYLITPLTPPLFDFSVGPGTMYVGGVRVEAPAGIPNAEAKPTTLLYSAQQEWLDHSDDPEWVTPSPNNPPSTELIYLFLREQEVSAVEDSDLKDVALGGPDTAQRTRLLQHVVRFAVQDPTCAGALAELQKHWATEGMRFNPRTMQLEPTATLKVTFSPAGPPPDPCNPQAQGGYLGADNQLIRVQISGVDQASGNPKFVWGFDDASFLYRLDLDPNNKQLLHLRSRPVDVSHQPRTQQAVEVLRSAAKLSNGEYVASISGVVLLLDKAYNPDTQMITLPAPLTKLPDRYYDPAQTPRVFLRVWEQESVFTPGTAVDLGTTGLQVTLQATNNIFHTGDYWLFAVRPTTPQQVYQERYLVDFQPPEGPRMWACPLEVIGWSAGSGTVVSDCRYPFDNLVNLTKRQQGCCTITVGPADITSKNTLQSIVDSAANVAITITAADPGSAGDNITVSIANSQVSAAPASFDFTVTETDIYPSLSLATMAGILGVQQTAGSQPGLAHLSAPPNTTIGAPNTNQTVRFVGGSASAKAQASVVNANGLAVFTLEAKKVGVDGNLTSATVSSVDANGNFTLGLTWQKTLRGVTLGNVQQGIVTDLAYEITAAPPAGRIAFPAEGSVQLRGGSDGVAGGAQATAATGTIFGNPTKICLKPGNYRLRSPLVLQQQHSNITIEGCTGGVTISVEKGQEKEGNFLSGMIQLSNAQNVTLHGLTLEMPLIAFFESGGTLAGLSGPQLQSLGEGDLLILAASVGITVAGCEEMTIEECIFDFPAPRPGTIFFAAGMFAIGDCTDFNMSSCTFEGPDLAGEAAIGALALTAGYLQSSIVQGGALVPSTLFNSRFLRNTFDNLDVGVFLLANSFGITAFEGNVMRNCLSGILTGFTLNAAAKAALGTTAAGDTASVNAILKNVIMSSLVQRGISIAAAYPLPRAFSPQRKLAFTAAQATPGATARDASGATVVEDTARSTLRGAAIGPEVQPIKGVRPLASQVLQTGGSVVDPVALNARFFASSVNLTANDIDAFVGDSTVGAFAVSVIEVDRKGFGAVNLTANKLRNNSPGISTVLIAGTVSCNATGNFIENRQAPNPDGHILPKSLVVAASPVAITGNVLIRPADYPTRVFNPPPQPALQALLSSWDFMNTVIP